MQVNTTDLLITLWRGFPAAAEFINPGYPGFLQSTGGLQLSLLITVCSIALAIVPGFILSLPGLVSKNSTSMPVKLITGLFSFVARGFTEVVRGIPIMTIALLFFYLPYPLFKLRVPPVVLAVSAFAVYASVYLGEIFRSGFRAVDKKTIEAAKVLGLSSLAILTRIRLPVAARVMIPALVNLLVTIFKDTSVLTAVAVGELTYTGRQLFVATPGNYSLILLLIVLIYWTVSFLGSKTVKLLESGALKGYHNRKENQ
jgi:polar amino acid transport system permease protein